MRLPGVRSRPAEPRRGSAR
uniref:ADRB2 protein n=1 Tax=Homo sapiens TaxID=9606 RepID=A2N4T7_HUMAN|nr:putative [Homo sapiens]